MTLYARSHNPAIISLAQDNFVYKYEGSKRYVLARVEYLDGLCWSEIVGEFQNKYLQAFDVVKISPKSQYFPSLIFLVVFVESP